MTKELGDRAVVLGGSIAGLVAARVLADAYAQVLIVERDELPTGARHRRGVPQGRHVHGLLARGQQALEELFGGLTADLTGDGVPQGDMLADTRLCFGGHRLHRGTSGLTMLCASRPRLESYLRARVRAMPSVTVLDKCDVVGLAATADRRRVRGARIMRRLDGSAEEILAADLVVDATGRGSRTPTWLQLLGYQRPPVEQLRIDVGYASRTYRIAPGALDGAQAILAAPAPGHHRGGALTAMENDQFLLTLFGVLGEHPPTNPREFADFADGLSFRDLPETLRDAEPLDEPVAFRFPASVRQRYERLTRLPDGLLVLGDAVCSLNPIYGKGMSVAALQALALRRHLHRGTRPRPRPFFREIGGTVDVAWNMVVGADLSFPGVEGRRTPPMRLINGYLARLHAGAAYDHELGRAFLRVSGLVDPPRALLRPAVVARVLRSVPRRAPGRPPTSQDRHDSHRPRPGATGWVQRRAL